MDETAFRTRLPDREQVRRRLVGAGLVGVIFYVPDQSLGSAAVIAAMVFVLLLAIDTAETAIGDYAGNVAVGGLLIVFAGTVMWPWLPGLLAGTAAGGWLVFDGIQHLRHGESRAEYAHLQAHDGGALSGVLRALVRRLLEPFRL
ncbi:hypothetical protein [Halapricum desulfuricans]|uniref:Putative membrane protein n=1 Tax=Halapricum desulfuricans TaxID=2841257 RepID=A0A897NC98_9EURY|nr:hypothetical protein [Halapricum desulfuricans]QSG08609.1 putative membrane protein [Halapricum desulfuricans]